MKSSREYRLYGGLEITDRIKVEISNVPALSEAINGYKEYICVQVLANELNVCNNVEGTEVDFEDFKANIKIEKA